MALYKGDIQLGGIGKGFYPNNQGTSGQYLKKVNNGNGYEWAAGGGGGGAEWGNITGTLSDQTDLNTALTGKADAGDLNTKTFYLSSTSDLTNAQAAYDWYNAGNNSLIVLGNQVYTFTGASSNAITFESTRILYGITDNKYNQLYVYELTLNKSGDTITSITKNNQNKIAALPVTTSTAYTSVYMPSNDYNPTTKKYVDDKINDTAYGNSWDGDTTHAPSKNAVYDKIDAIDTAINGLGTAAACDTGTGSGDVPVLDANGKLDTSTLPGVALTDTFTVTNKADLTSLSSAQQGDIGIVTAESKTYVLSADPYSTASNWKELLTPTDTVTSVNSKTGAVVLDADDISDSTTTNKFVTATDKTTWSGKQDALTLPATPTQGNLVVRGANNETLVDGGAIPTGITNDTAGTTTTITTIWGGSEAEFGNKTTTSTGLYFVF